MVIARAAVFARTAQVALVLSAAGCLSKPAIPSDAGAGSDDAPVDASMTDAYVYPGCTPLPATFTMRSIPAIANLDRRDGTMSDDVVIFGRDSANGGAYAYLFTGGAQFDPNCYQRRFRFDEEIEILPLDAFVGEVTGDTNPDLVLYGRETLAASPQHEVLLFAGESSGALAATPLIKKFPFANPFDDAWGGTESMPDPVYLTATTQSGTTDVANLFIGGLYNWKVEIGVTTDPVLGGAAKVTGTDNLFLVDSSQPIQDVEPHVAGNPSQLIIVTSGLVLRVRSNGMRAGGNSQYEILNSTPLLGTQRRSGRFVRGQVAGATVGVTQNFSTGYQFIGVSGTSTEPAVISPFDVNGVDANDTTDMALGNLDDDPRLDLVAITDLDAANPPPLLRVYTNLGFNGTNQVSYVSVRELALPADYRILGTGDFDGNPATSPQILVYPVTPGKPVLCYRLSGGTVAPCS